MCPRSRSRSYAPRDHWDPDAGKLAKIEIKAMPDASTR